MIWRIYLFLTACIIAVAFAGQAAAYHTLDGSHWHPPATVQANGGSCAQPCLWFRMIDRTGYGSNWKTNLWPASLNRIRQAFPGYSVQFTTARGSRFYLWTCSDGQCVSHHDEAEAATPVGSVFVGYNDWGTNGSNCDGVSPPWPQPFCAIPDTHHRAKCVIGAGSGGGQEAADTMVHEMGHCLGLGHRILNAQYQCDGASVMCGLSYPNFDAHDRAELTLLYGHAH